MRRHLETRIVVINFYRKKENEHKADVYEGSLHYNVEEHDNYSVDLESVQVRILPRHYVYLNCHIVSLKLIKR